MKAGRAGGVGTLEVAVKALIVRRGRVLLLKRGPRATPAPGGWDTPGGKLEFGEEPEAALHREIREELGSRAFVSPRRVLNVWTLLKDRQTQLVGITFLCGLEGEPRLSDASEHVALEWVPIARALQMRDVGAPLKRTIARYLADRPPARAAGPPATRVRTRGTASKKRRARRG